MAKDFLSLVADIQNLLAQYTFNDKNNGYLDISDINTVNKDSLQEARNILPADDPLTNALGLILTTMHQGPLVVTKMAINELLKSYLFQINNENQEACTQKYLTCVYEVFLVMITQNYPYQELLWEYLSQCFNTISSYLIKQRLVDGCQAFLDKVAAMGKSAAQHGLHTSTIQHFLHNLEVRAQEQEFTELADSAKNHRFNLETF